MRILIRLLPLIVLVLSTGAHAYPPPATDKDTAAHVDPLPATDKEIETCAADDRCKARCMNDKGCMGRLQKWLSEEMTRLNAESDDLDKKAAEVSKPDAVPQLKEDKVPPATDK